MVGKSLGIGGTVLVAALQAWAPGQVSQPAYVTSALCMSCHNGIMTPTWEDVSFGFSWRTGMMANAARDPYWQASVRREVMDHPGAGAAIENECSRCHMPLSNATTRATGRPAAVFQHLPVGQTVSPLGALAADGVSCVACHSITPDGLGSEESFTGGFTLASTGDAFGPFQVDDGRAGTMQSATALRPAASDHLAQAEFCATCHTLITHSLGPDGSVIGELPEQVPFLEWSHSSYRDAASCQSCHMPVVKGETPLTSVLGQPRPGVSRHVFLGGNAFMQRLLGRNQFELGVVPVMRDMNAAADLTVAHLGGSSSRISIDGAEIADGILTADVSVENFAGHKLPTAYPSRRVWIELQVKDTSGRTVFWSGAPLADGSIAGNDNDADGRRYEPHHLEISSPDDVQIYETILEGPDGSVTTGLLTATAYRKDNRLLPDGFEKETAEDRVAVRGEAVGDGDFTGGGDQVRYVVSLGSSPSRYTVTAALWYQSIGFRWAQNLSDYDAPESHRFVRLYTGAADVSAVKLASAQRMVE
jgi:hypothetical protein